MDRTKGDDDIYHDPLDAVTDLGIRVIWADSLSADVILIEDEHIALVDTSTTRRRAAQLLISALTGDFLAA